MHLIPLSFLQKNVLLIQIHSAVRIVSVTILKYRFRELSLTIFSRSTETVKFAHPFHSKPINSYL